MEWEGHFGDDDRMLHEEPLGGENEKGFQNNLVTDVIACPR